MSRDVGKAMARKRHDTPENYVPVMMSVGELLWDGIAGTVVGQAKDAAPNQSEEGARSRRIGGDFSVHVGVGGGDEALLTDVREGQIKHAHLGIKGPEAPGVPDEANEG